VLPQAVQTPTVNRSFLLLFFKKEALPSLTLPELRMYAQRRTDIDRAKGLAILLVVFGHLVARADPAGVDWYEPLRRAVYAFHMPFFLYLSGLVAVISGMLLAPQAAWPGLAVSRARRLLLPFFGIDGLIVLGKILAARVMAVDNVPAGVLAGLQDLLWHTRDSPALSVWYLFVLFVVSLGCVGGVGGERGRLPWVLGGCVLLYVLPLPDYLYLDRVGTYAVFFGIGAWAGLLGARWDGFMDRYWPGLLGLLVVGLAAVAWFGAQWPEKVVLLPMGALSMPAIHGCLRYCAARSTRMLSFLGRYSFVIYLFNTVFIGLAKGVILFFCSWDGGDFLPFAVVLMAAGILGPVGLKFAVLRRLPVLDQLTD
jgi:fucose 4-O-acetylase-like acetyltransferase